MIWLLLIIALLSGYCLLATAVRAIRRRNAQNANWGRLEAEINNRGALLTPSQIAEFHATRWDGD